MNVYSDNHNYAICHLYKEVDSLPAFHYMGGDFNCHLEVWDSNVSHHRWAAQHLLSIANDLGLEWARPSNHSLTHIPHNSELDGSVIDLVFTIPDPDECFLPRIVHDLRSPLDHSPVASTVSIADTDIHIKHTVLPRNSEEEKEFLGTAALSIQLLHLEGLDSVARIEEVLQGILDTFSLAWQKYTPRRSPSRCAPSPGGTRSVPMLFASIGRTGPPGSGNLSTMLNAGQRGCSLMLTLRRSPKPICACGT
jgi:hypothetical protein